MLARILRDQAGHVVGAGARPPIGAATLRTDAWWGRPATVALVLVSFVIYATWAAVQNAHYYAAPYLSPFYSPCLTASCAHLSFGRGLPDVSLPVVGLVSPAFLILAGPGLFRLTCYYYRKAYYRSLWLAPVACAVPDARAGYTGETRWPLLLQNLHRYTWYVAVLFVAMLTWDAVLAVRFPEGVGVGVGTVAMWANVILLAAYTFSCHSCRHLCGGHLDVFSRAPVRYRLWRAVSRLNERHPTYAWLSLFGVALTDLYIRLVSMGIIHDYRWVF
jgi:hypothetical protein